MPDYKSRIIKLIAKSRIIDIKHKYIKRDIVLLYHSIENEVSGYPHSVAKENFEAHLEYLASRYKVVSLEELMCCPSSIPRATITFDDAYDDFYTNVYPILLQNQLPATVFVPTHFIDSPHLLSEKESSGPPHRDHLTWDQMREMRSSGLVEFESHSHLHVDYVDNTHNLIHDIELSMHIIERELGRRPKFFAYPYGSHNENTHKIILSNGFENVFTVLSTHIKGGQVHGRYDISRRNEEMDRFKLTIAGINLNSIRKLKPTLYSSLPIMVEFYSVLEFTDQV